MYVDQKIDMDLVQSNLIDIFKKYNIKWWSDVICFEQRNKFYIEKELNRIQKWFELHKIDLIALKNITNNIVNYINDITNTVLLDNIQNTKEFTEIINYFLVQYWNNNIQLTNTEISEEISLYWINLGVFNNYIKKWLITKCSNFFSGIKVSELKKDYELLFNSKVIEILFEELQCDGLIKLNNDVIFVKQQHFIDYVSKIESPVTNIRWNEIFKSDNFKMNLIKWKIGYSELKAAALDIMKHAHEKNIIFFEQNYAYFIANYASKHSKHFYKSINMEWLSNFFELAWNFKEKENTIKLQHCYYDNRLIGTVKKQVEDFSKEFFIKINDKIIESNKTKFLDHVITNYAKNEIKYEDFIILYDDLLMKYAPEKFDIWSLKNRERFEANFSNKDNILWQQWRTFRYFETKNVDVDFLTRVINIFKFKNKEISSLVLFRNNEEVMEELDIRNEYELHNLLKKIWPVDDTSVKFGRMPNILIGNGSIVEQISEIIHEFAPITKEELGSMFEQEYGVKSMTLLGGVDLSKFNKYYDGTQYVLDNKKYTKEVINVLKSILTKDVYEMDEFKKIIYSHYDNLQINFLNILDVGYRLYKNHVISTKFKSSSEYVNFLLSRT